LSKPLVILDHDGGVDDYLALSLLLTFDNVEALGVVVTPADCYIEPAVSATRRILDLAGRSEIPVAASTVRGLNAFPRKWRADSYSIDHLAVLNERESIEAPLLDEPGQAYLARTLREAPRPVTLLITGPLSTLAAALDTAPEIEGNIERVLWMGGALNVPGGVQDSGHDGSAEWNVYWDPIAAHRVWASRVPIMLCPIDITQTVPCTSDFVRALARQRRHPLSDLAAQCYALVMHQTYYFWDVLTTAYLGCPELFTVREWETAIVPTGPSQGRTLIQAGGRRIRALHSVDTRAFYAYIKQQWAR
jgi:purine nucleosidase